MLSFHMTKVLDPNRRRDRPDDSEGPPLRGSLRRRVAARIMRHINRRSRHQTCQHGRLGGPDAQPVWSRGARRPRAKETIRGLRSTGDRVVHGLFECPKVPEKATPEVRHSLLRRDVGDPVANVVAALQAHDPELAELLINKTAENIKIRDISEPRHKHQTVSDEGTPSPTTWRCSDCPASSLTTRC